MNIFRVDVGKVYNSATVGIGYYKTRSGALKYIKKAGFTYPDKGGLHLDNVDRETGEVLDNCRYAKIRKIKVIE
jgi:hypothetical protein